MQNKNNNKINQLGHRQRIKKNFIESPTESFSDETLLELVLFMLYARMDVKPLAKKIIHNFGSLRHFVLASEKDIQDTFAKDKKYQQYGDNTIKSLYFGAKLIRELTIKVINQKLYDKEATVFNSWQDIIIYLKQKFGHLTQEHFSIVFLDVGNKILKIHTISVGTIDEVSAYEREIVKKAIECGSVNLILVHNHFSGNIKPSIEDKELTKKVFFACKVMGINVLDHVIVSADNYYSFKENDLI